MAFSVYPSVDSGAITRIVAIAAASSTAGAPVTYLMLVVAGGGPAPAVTLTSGTGSTVLTIQVPYRDPSPTLFALGSSLNVLVSYGDAPATAPPAAPAERFLLTFACGDATVAAAISDTIWNVMVSGTAGQTFTWTVADNPQDASGDVAVPLLSARNATVEGGLTTSALTVAGPRTYLAPTDGADDHWIMAGGTVEGTNNALGLNAATGRITAGPGWMIDTALVPIGTVLQWWRPADSIPVPAEFAVCDGSVVAAGLHAFKLADGTPFNQPITLPDLRNTFVLGASPAAAEGTSASPGDQSANAPGIGGHGGSNVPRPTDHHHAVSLSHEHAAMTTAGASRARTDSVALGTAAVGEHTHHVIGGAHVSWQDNLIHNNTAIPTLTDPKDRWLPVLPDHDTNAAGAHAHAIGPHDHDITHTHAIGAFSYGGTVESGPVDAGGSTDVVPRYVGLLMIMRVR